MLGVTKEFYRQVLTIFPVTVALFLFGCVFGWVAPALAYFESEECPYPVTESQLTWIASAFLFSEIGSPIVGGLMADKLGRKGLLILATFLQAFSWFLLLIGNSAIVVLISRFLLGGAGGINDQAWSQYIGEVTSPAARGIFGTVNISMFVGGIMFQFIISTFLSYHMTVVIPFIVSIVNLFLNFFMVETPTHLLSKNKDDLAIKNLAWLRGEEDVEKVKAEFQELKKYLDEQKQLNRPSIKEIFASWSEYKLGAVTVAMFTLLNSSGHMIILTYQTLMFDLFKSAVDGNTLTVMYGVLQFISTLISPFLIETAGRRTLLIVGFIIAAIVQIANTWLFYIAGKYDYDVPYVEQILLITFNIYGVVFMICLFPTAYILKSELFPQKLKIVGGALCTLTHSLVAFIVVKPFLYINDELGMYANFAIGAVVCTVGVFYACIYVPETKGKSLVEIQQNYDKKNNNSKDKLSKIPSRPNLEA